MQGKRGFEFSLNHLQYILFPRFSALSVQQHCNVHKQTAYDSLNIPPKPKRPMTPFFKFMQQVRPLILREQPEIKATELVKVVAQKWNTVDSKLKMKLEEEYKNELVHYSKIKNEYNIQLTPEQKAEIRKIEIHASELKAERRTKQKSKELGRPKQPLSIFFRYLMSRKSEQSKFSDVKEWVKTVSAEWKTVSPDIKAKFETERKHDYDKWLRDLKIWEDQMIQQGHLDIVRTGSIKALSKKTLKK